MILHITTTTAWEMAIKRGEYLAYFLSIEGFIHCSTPAQILGVANSFYSKTPHLVLLWIDQEQVASPIHWELPAETSPNAVEVFPHIYGPINLGAVTAVFEFAPDTDGIFRDFPKPE